MNLHIPVFRLLIAAIALCLSSEAIAVPFFHFPHSDVDKWISDKTANPNKLTESVQAPNQTMSADIVRYATTLSIALLSFGVFITAVIAFLGSRGVITRDNTFKLIGLTFVVTIGVFLIPAGFDQAQIAPTSTLLGTIVGYLFGRTREADPASMRDESRPKPK